MSGPYYGVCEECNRIAYVGWCRACNAKRFQQNFKNWTSDNDVIDKFIQDAQLSAKHWHKLLEWIPYDRFYDIEYITKGGFGKVYRANWTDGWIYGWDNKNKNWNRYDQNKFVALKSLNGSKNVTLEFINEITSHHKLNDDLYVIRFYGITLNPETKNYMMVLEYAEHGNFRNYLDTNKSYRSWNDKINDLYYIASGLNIIHNSGLIHQDLHIGNILKLSNISSSACITDMGLCKPASDFNNALENSQNTKKSIYGVLPYIAPEILRGQNYTKASDIYSFGIIMYEVVSGLPPYYDVGSHDSHDSHDSSLAIKVCYGLRPRFNIKVPQLIVNLIKRCLDANPLKRPTANEFSESLQIDISQLKVSDDAGTL